MSKSNLFLTIQKHSILNPWGPRSDWMMGLPKDILSLGKQLKSSLFSWTIFVIIFLQLSLQYCVALLRLGHQGRRTHWNNFMSPSDCVRLKQIGTRSCSTSTDMRSVEVEVLSLPPLNTYTPTQNDESMFLGMSLFNPELAGWAGHTQDGGHFSVEGKYRDHTNIPHNVVSWWLGRTTEGN